MDHRTFIARGNQLIDDRALDGRNIAILDQLLVTYWLFELAGFDLEAIPIMDIEVSVLDARLPKSARSLTVAEIEQ